MKDAGNIPVDRKNKDNQKLFSGTFEALKLNEAVAIFPEGTSYTEPRLQEIKDGASWVGFTLAFCDSSFQNECSVLMKLLMSLWLPFNRPYWSMQRI